MTADTEPLYAWETLYEDRWVVIRADLKGLPTITSEEGQDGGVVALIARSRLEIDMLGVPALAHHDKTGLPIRKVRYDVTEVTREVP